MIVLLAAMLAFFFLALGAVAFLACVLVPQWRKVALSTALWFAIWGPCCVVLLIVALLGVAAGGLALHATQMHWQDAQKIFAAIGWGSAISGGAVTGILASVLAWLHQAAIHRVTFFLFRFYATVVVAGIGSVFGLGITLFAMIESPFPFAAWIAAISIPVLVALFGAKAYQNARALRGSAPTQFTWITPEEFAGPAGL